MKGGCSTLYPTYNIISLELKWTGNKLRLGGKDTNCVVPLNTILPTQKGLFIRTPTPLEKKLNIVWSLRPPPPPPAGISCVQQMLTADLHNIYRVTITIIDSKPG